MIVVCFKCKASFNSEPTNSLRVKMPLPDFEFRAILSPANHIPSAQKLCARYANSNTVQTSRGFAYSQLPVRRFPNEKCLLFLLYKIIIYIDIVISQLV